MMGATGGGESVVLDDATREKYMRDVRLRLADPVLYMIDETGFGIDLPQRLLWEVYIVRQDITRTGEWESGRGSEPDYSAHAWTNPR